MSRPPPDVKRRESSPRIKRCTRSELPTTVETELDNFDCRPAIVSRYPSGRTRVGSVTNGGAQTLPMWCRDLLTSQTSLETLEATNAAALQRTLIREHADDGWESDVLACRYQQDPAGLVAGVSRLLQEGLWQEYDFQAQPDPLNEIGVIAEAYKERCQTHGYLPPDRVIPWSTDLLQAEQSLELRPMMLTQGEELIPMGIEFVQELASHTDVTVFITPNAAIRRPYTKPGSPRYIERALLGDEA